MEISLHISIQRVMTPVWFLFSLTEATVELSLDSPLNERKKDVTAKPSASAPALSAAAASLAKPQSAALEEVHTYLIPEWNSQCDCNKVMTDNCASSGIYFTILFISPKFSGVSELWEELWLV